MELQYLLFDFSDEDSGAGSFDAMASVRPERVAAVRAEVEAVLRWARENFAAADPAGEWDFDLQSRTEDDGRQTLTLTVSGSRAFCKAFRRAFQFV